MRTSSSSEILLITHKAAQWRNPDHSIHVLLHLLLEVRKFGWAGGFHLVNLYCFWVLGPRLIYWRETFRDFHKDLHVKDTNNMKMRFHYFLYCVVYPHNTTLNYIITKELERIWKEVVVVNQRFYLGIFLEVLRKTKLPVPRPGFEVSLSRIHV
jgi:hypothetical protein